MRRFDIQLSVSRKTFLFRLLIGVFIGLNFLISYSIYSSNSITLDSSQEYEKLIESHLKSYKLRDSRFQQFNFYENFDDLLYENREFNEDYRSKVNQFSNLTQKEFYRLYGLMRSISAQKNFGEVSKFDNDYYDWSRKDAVIRDERGFNISHIFAALTAIEYQINENQSTAGNSSWITLSAQEIVDCCSECLVEKSVENVYRYIISNGVTVQGLYPYENNVFDQTPRKCRRDQFPTPRYWIQKYHKTRGCGGLQLYLTKGPLVVQFDGSSLRDYNYGIMGECGFKRNHYATIVGISYNSWKLQNSWGRKWGERGFLRVGAGDTCGICKRSTVPVLKKDV